LNEEVDAPMYTREGLKFKSGNMTLSGSPITAQRNTAISVFAAYRGLRLAGYSAVEAYAKLGLFGGDDSLQGHLTGEIVTSAFAYFGLSVKRNVIPRGKPVVFLGRIFIDPWNNLVDCIADVKRQLAKLHLSTHRGTPPHLVLRRKADAILVTDPKTPLLGDWARMIQRLYPNKLTEAEMKITSNINLSWFSRQEGRRFEVTLGADTLLQVVSENVGKTPAEVDAYCKLLRGVRTLEDFQKLPALLDESPACEITSIYQGLVRDGSKPRPEPRNKARGVKTPYVDEVGDTTIGIRKRTGKSSKSSKEQVGLPSDPTPKLVKGFAGIDSATLLGVEKN